MKPNLKVSLCFLAIHCALFSNLALAGSDVPPGFEELVSGQNVWLNVNLLGQSAGLFEANVTLETVQFKEPQSVLNALNLPLKAGTPDYQQMLTTLSAPLARHGNLVCGSNANATGCGYLDTDSLALIYDENNSAADVFVSKKLLPESGGKTLYYTPSTQTENALIHQQTLNVAAQDDYQSLSLQGSGALGILTNGYVGFDWSLDSYKSDDSDSQTVSVDDFYFRQSIGKRHYVQAGRMDSRDLSSNLGGNISFSQLPLNAIDGLRAGSSLSYLNLAEASKGSPLVVLLSSKSRVDAYRGNQLLGTFYLNNGSNTLDTGNFPSGSYAVTLRIYENNQLVRTDTQPFTKTGGISDGHMQWFIQAGETADNKVVSSNNNDDDNNSTSRKPVVQAGARLPVFAELTATAGIANTDNENYGETGLQWTHGFNGKLIDGVLDMQASVFGGTEGSRGNVEQISYNDGFSLSVYRNAAYGKSCTSADVDENDYADIGCYESVNATFSVPVKGWSASLGYTYNKNTSLSPDSSSYDPTKPFEDNMINNTESQSTSNTLQLSMNKSFNWKKMTITTRFGTYRRQSSSDSDNDKGVYVGFSLSRNTPKDAQLRSSNTSLSTDYQGSQNGDGQMTYNASQNWDWGSNNERELGIDIGGTDTDNANAAIHGRLNSQHGEGELTLSDSYNNQQKSHESAVTGSYSSSIAVSKSGFFLGPGGAGSPGAAVAVKVKGNEVDPDAADDALIDVSVQGGGATQMKQNSKALFPVTGFEEGKVSVNESRDASNGSQASITQGAGSQNLFLLPGKMKLREVTMESHYTYVGQLTTATGIPLANSTMLNATAFSISEDGGFTAEMNSLAKTLYVSSDHQTYQCAVTIKSSRDVVRYVGKTLCKPAQFADLPEYIREMK